MVLASEQFTSDLITLAALAQKVLNNWMNRASFNVGDLSTNRICKDLVNVNQIKHGTPQPSALSSLNDVASRRHTPLRSWKQER